MYRYFDIHSHLNDTPPCDTLRVQNIRVQGTEVALAHSQYFTAGIHPYDIENFNEHSTSTLHQILNLNGCIAVGECGIDKTRNNIYKQSKIFSLQCSIAQQRQLPIIVHCVKAQSETLSALKSVTTPKIFHSYSKTSPQMLNDPTIYFSLSHRNLNGLSKIPLHKLLLESDEDNQISIHQLYQEVAQLKNIELNELITIIENTFYKIFKI